jgi:DnaJ-class molecular chaperone
VSSTPCHRCHGTGRATFEGGFSGKCPDCLGKGRQDDQDRKVNRILLAIAIAITVLAIVLPRLH